MAKTMIGFDIGACQVKLAVWDGSKVRRALSADTPDNLVKDGRIVSYAAMADFIKETLKKNKVSGRNCAVVLPASHAFLRRVSMPAMTVEQLKINLPYEFRDFLTMSKDKYFYDYAVNGVTRDEEGKPVQLDLTAAAAPKEVIGEYRDMFRRAGLRLRTAVPAECAYANLLRGRDEAKEYCFLDLGHTAARIYIYSGARFEASRVIDIGLEAVDRAIADSTGVDEHLARSYKESDYQGAQNLESAQQVYQAIALDARKAVNFYGFSNRESNLQDLWFCGGGVHIPALRTVIGQAVDLHTHTVEELMPPAAEDAGDLTSFAAAVGAAVQ